VAVEEEKDQRRQRKEDKGKMVRIAGAS